MSECRCDCHRESRKTDRERNYRIMESALDIMIKHGCDYFTAMHTAHEREFIRVLKESLDIPKENL